MPEPELDIETTIITRSGNPLRGWRVEISNFNPLLSAPNISAKIMGLDDLKAGQEVYAFGPAQAFGGFEGFSEYVVSADRASITNKGEIGFIMHGPEGWCVMSFTSTRAVAELQKILR